MRSLCRVVVYSLLVAAAACHDAAAPDPRSESPDPNVPVDPGSGKVELYTAPWFQTSVNPAHPITSMVVIGGQQVHLWAKAVDATGKLMPIQTVSWSTSDSQLVSVQAIQACSSVSAGCYLAQVSAVGNGEATVTATINGVSATIKVASFLQPAISDVASVEFSVLKLESGSFAPQLRVSVANGAPDIDVIALTLLLPGLNPWRFCATRHVASGSSAEMFGQYYGDYELEFDAYDMPPGTPGVIVYFRLADGTIVSSTFTGPVLPGAPAEYRGGSVANPWQFCGGA